RNRIVRVDSVFTEQIVSRRALHGRKAKNASSVVPQNEAHPAAAQHARAIEDDDAIRFDFHARPSSRYSGPAIRLRASRRGRRIDTVCRQSFREPRKPRTTMQAGETRENAPRATAM